MPVWSTAPPDGSPTNTYRLVRTPPVGKLVGILTCDEMLGTCIHFYNGRTIPHDPDDCPACDHQRPYRWMCYLSAILDPNGEHVIVEVTARVHAAFENVTRKLATIRGVRFCLERPNGKRNGRVNASFAKNPERDVQLPAVPDIRAIMQTIWRGNMDLPTNGLTHERPENAPGQANGKPVKSS